MLVSCVGLFYTFEGSVCCTQDGSQLNLSEILSGYEGRFVQTVIRHFPEGPLNPELWGGGCCKWQPSECPFGHSEHPSKLYADASKGVLTRDNQQWKVGHSALRFDWMEGHHGQFILFSPQPANGEGLKGMIQSLSGLKDVVEMLRGETE